MVLKTMEKEHDYILLFNSSVEKKTLKSNKRDNNSNEREVKKYRSSRQDEEFDVNARKSRSRERFSRRSKDDRHVSQRSRSQSDKKNERSKKKSASPKRMSSPIKSSDRSKMERNKRRAENHEKIRKNRRSWSKPVEKETAFSPKKVMKRKSPTPKRNDRVSRRSRSTRRRSVSSKRFESRSNRKRGPTPRNHSTERKRSPSPKRYNPERKIEKSTEKQKRREGSPFPKTIRKRSLSRDHQTARSQHRRSLSRSRRQQRRKSPVSRKRSISRSRSPITRKTSRYSRSPATRYTKGPDRNRQNERRSRSRSLSYSPARRNPEKYRDILDTKDKSNEKIRKPAPVVKLHPTTSDRDSSENDTPERKLIDEQVEENPIDQNQDKELKRLRALKSELAVKAKESLEKKIISETASSTSTLSIVPGNSYSRNNVSPTHNIEPERAREMEIVAQTVAISTKEKQAAIKAREEKRKISIKPFKIDGSIPVKGGEVVKNDVAIGLKASDMEKGRKSRSHSRTSPRYINNLIIMPLKLKAIIYFRRSRDVSSSSSGSSHSRSSSGSTHSDASSSSSSSASDEPSRPRSRGHSGSIPRRAGSPSFLDRRRITR